MRRFCSSVPKTTTGFSPKMFMCNADAPDMPAPLSLTARISTAASARPRPEPPCSGGMQMTEPAAVGHGAIQLFGETAVAVLAQPILVVEGAAQHKHRRRRMRCCSSVNTKFIVRPCRMQHGPNDSTSSSLHSTVARTTTLWRSLRWTIRVRRNPLLQRVAQSLPSSFIQRHSIGRCRAPAARNGATVVVKGRKGRGDVDGTDFDVLQPGVGEQAV